MTSTRPQGERVHTPHPDVTIVTTTSTLLLGPKTPVEADETSVKEHLAKKDEAEGVQPPRYQQDSVKAHSAQSRRCHLRLRRPIQRRDWAQSQTRGVNFELRATWRALCRRGHLYVVVFLDLGGNLSLKYRK